MTYYENLPGRSRENARAALKKAVENGFSEEEVLTTRGGYLIPTEGEPPAVEDDQPTEAEEVEEEPAKPARKRTTTKSKE